jgi:hypothetical protein
MLQSMGIQMKRDNFLRLTLCLGLIYAATSYASDGEVDMSFTTPKDSPTWVSGTFDPDKTPEKFLIEEQKKPIDELKSWGEYLVTQLKSSDLLSEKLIDLISDLRAKNAILQIGIIYASPQTGLSTTPTKYTCKVPPANPRKLFQDEVESPDSPDMNTRPTKKVNSSDDKPYTTYGQRLRE